MSEPNTPQLIGTREAAAIIGISRQHMARIAERELKAHRGPAGIFLYDPVDVRHYATARQKRQEAQA